MPAIRVNFSEVKDLEAIPAATYEAQLIKVEDSTKEDAEYTTLKWTWEVQGGEYNRRQLSTWTSFNPKALFRLRDLLVELGMSKEELKSPNGIDFDPEDFIGTIADIEVTIEPYNGRDVNRIENVTVTQKASASSGGLRLR